MTLQNVARQTPFNTFRVFAGRAVLTLAMIKDMLGDLHLDSVSFPQSTCSFGCGEPCKNARNSVTMAPKFTPDEQAEIELMLWEYDRDGRIAIERLLSP